MKSIGWQQPRRILVISCKPDFLGSVVAECTRRRYVALAETSPINALGILERNSAISLAICGINFPGDVNGVSFAIQCTLRLPHVRLLLLPAEQDVEYVQGVCPFIVYPAGPMEVLDAAERVLAA